MAECYLEIGLEEDTILGGMFPSVFPMNALIPDSHEHLFRFLNFDLFRIEEPLKEYLSCLHSGSEAKKQLLRTVVADLRELHPYYTLSRENIQSFLNDVFADYIQHSFPELDISAKREMFSKVAIRKLSIASDPEEMIPQDSGFSRDNRHIVENLFSLQDDIRRLVFLVLDDSNEFLADLPTIRRTALYSLAYSAESLAHITANFGIQPSPKMSAAILKMDFEDLDKPEKQKKARKTVDEPENGQAGLQKLRKSLDQIYWNPDEPISPAVREAVLATNDVLDPVRITYEIPSLDNLLAFEVYRMITEETHIRRCGACHRYFIPENENQRFCSVCSEHSIHSDVSTNKSSPTPSFSGDSTKNVTTVGTQPGRKTPLSQLPVYAVYRMKYKTRKARIKAKTMTNQAFDEWNQQALEKLKLVGAGKMDATEFENWLNNT